MAIAKLKNGTELAYKITLSQYCDEYGLNRLYMRKGWHSTEYELFKRLTAKILKIDESEIKQCHL